MRVIRHRNGAVSYVMTAEEEDDVFSALVQTELHWRHDYLKREEANPDKEDWVGRLIANKYVTLKEQAKKEGRDI